MDDKMIFKKIALRFLKEIGLYKQWKNYLRTPAAHRFMNDTDKWWHRNFIISIFGATNFSSYLSRKKIKFDNAACFYIYFAIFVESYYPEHFDREAYFRETGEKSFCVTKNDLVELFPTLKNFES